MHEEKRSSAHFSKNKREDGKGLRSSAETNNKTKNEKGRSSEAGETKIQDRRRIETRN